MIGAFSRNPSRRSIGGIQGIPCLAGGSVSSLLGVIVILLLTFLVINQHQHLKQASFETNSRGLRLQVNEVDKVFEVASRTHDVESFMSELKKKGVLSDAAAGQGLHSNLVKKHGVQQLYHMHSIMNQDEKMVEDANSDLESSAVDADSDAGAESVVKETLNKVRTARRGSSPIKGDPTLDLTLPVDGGPPPMSAQLALKFGVNNSLIVTWANNALFDFIKSWVWRMKDVGITNYMVGAMDIQIGRSLVSACVPSFAMYPVDQSHSGVGADHLAWGGEGFHKMGRQKISLAKMFLSFGMDLLLVDADVVIVKDVFPYFTRFPMADILVSTDLLSTPLEPGDEGLEKSGGAGAPMNIGIMYFRSNPNTSAFVDRWLEEINQNDKLWDQNAFNELARAGWDPYVKVHPDCDRVFIGFNGSLTVGVLPTASFTGGHTYYIQKLYEVQKVEPYAVHATFQYGGNIGKRNRMREAMLFYDDEEYYTGDSYVQIDVLQTPNISSQEFMVLNYSDKKKYNEAGVNMQMESIWAGIGLSVMLNRAIIVPKIGCYCDRYWMKLDECRIPGADKQRLPFVCPMDYILQPDLMADNESSILLRWRESSFLENPRCPSSVRASKLTIVPDADIKEPVDKWNAQEGGPVLLVPTGFTVGSLKRVLILKNYTGVKVLHFKNPIQSFAGLESDEMRLAFEKRKAKLKPVFQPEKSGEGDPM